MDDVVLFTGLRYKLRLKNDHLEFEFMKLLHTVPWYRTVRAP